MSNYIAPVPKESTVSTDNQDLITLTADIVSAHVSNNSVPTAEVAALIQSVYGALGALGSPVQETVAEKPKGAVSLRSSIKPDFLVSMIDGKPYKMLRRHISQHGYTPESYREAFGLPRDYPMVAANYAEQRRALAHKIGLGRKPRAAAAPAPAPKRRGRKPATPEA
jgi:predicted transcriptional regulator